MPTTTARPHDGLELLDLIADTLGHTPTDSIALLATHHPAGLTAHRIDLTADADHDADTLLATLDRLTTPAAIVIAAYATTAWPTAPHAHLRRIRTRLEQAGYAVHDTLISTGTQWGHPDHEPHPLPRRRGPQTDPALRTAFHAAYRHATARTLHRDATGPAPIDELVRNALDHPDFTALAALAAAIAQPPRRAAILHRLAWGAAPSVDPLQLLEQHSIAVAPEPARLELAETLLRALSSLASDRRALAGTLAMLGWVLAAQGRGTAAAQAIDHALSVDPDDELAGDLHSWLDAGGLPPWCTPGSGERP